MHLSETVAKYQMLAIGDHILAAVSGGADSVALLYGLLELQEHFSLAISVCHINHNLRGEDARADADFVRQLCLELNLPLFLYSKKIERDGLSLEEAARRLRYTLLFKAAKGCKAKKIALGHNLNDNAETLLLRLCRGTGLSGLRGILPVRDENGFTLIRPLIETDRSDIEAFLKAKCIPYRTDFSNFDKNFSRNRIRHDVMPVLKKINSQAPLMITQSALLLREDDELLESLSADILKRCLTREGCLHSVQERRLHSVQEKRLHIPVLLEAPKALRRRVIRAALNQERDISRVHISQIESLLEGQSNKETHLPSGIRVRREYDYLLFYSGTQANFDAFCFDIPLDTPVYIPALGCHLLAAVKTYSITFLINSQEMCTKYFNYDKISGSLQLRSRQTGDRIAISGVGRKKLKTEFSDRKIPKAQRDSIPLLAVGSDILWIMDNIDFVSAGAGRTSIAYTPEPGCRVLAVEVLTYGEH